MSFAKSLSPILQNCVKLIYLFHIYFHSIFQFIFPLKRSFSCTGIVKQTYLERYQHGDHIKLNRDTRRFSEWFVVPACRLFSKFTFLLWLHPQQVWLKTIPLSVLQMNFGEADVRRIPTSVCSVLTVVNLLAM